MFFRVLASGRRLLEHPLEITLKLILTLQFDWPYLWRVQWSCCRGSFHCHEIFLKLYRVYHIHVWSVLMIDLQQVLLKSISITIYLLKFFFKGIFLFDIELNMLMWLFCFCLNVGHDFLFLKFNINGKSFIINNTMKKTLTKYC